jgi:hypothetical protein
MNFDFNAADVMIFLLTSSWVILMVGLVLPLVTTQDEAKVWRLGKLILVAGLIACGIDWLFPGVILEWRVTATFVLILETVAATRVWQLRSEEYPFL